MGDLPESTGDYSYLDRSLGFMFSRYDDLNRQDSDNKLLGLFRMDNVDNPPPDNTNDPGIYNCKQLLGFNKFKLEKYNSKV